MIHYLKYTLLFLFLCFACKQKEVSDAIPDKTPDPVGVTIKILGIAQDAGFPQIQCKKTCCNGLWDDPSRRKMVASIGLTDHDAGKSWLFDATPDIKFQLQDLLNEENTLSGVFLSHAHIGHYTGLMHFGREAMGTTGLPVFAMPRMNSFLSNNGPWSQLVALNNVELINMENKTSIQPINSISVMPIEVPHRDEFSETVGFYIAGPEKKALFIPDIDKWEKWSDNIIELIKTTDYAFLDGTFFANGEIPGRDMSQIPHPFIEESMELFKDLPNNEKVKIHFIHFNHTNPILDPNSEAYQSVIDAGFNICDEGDIFQL